MACVLPRFKTPPPWSAPGRPQCGASSPSAGRIFLLSRALPPLPLQIRGHYTWKPVGVVVVYPSFPRTLIMSLLSFLEFTSETSFLWLQRLILMTKTGSDNKPPVGRFHYSPISSCRSFMSADIAGPPAFLRFLRCSSDYLSPPVAVSPPLRKRLFR